MSNVKLGSLGRYYMSNVMYVHKNLDPGYPRNGNILSESACWCHHFSQVRCAFNLLFKRLSSHSSRSSLTRQESMFLPMWMNEPCVVDLSFVSLWTTIGKFSPLLEILFPSHSHSKLALLKFVNFSCN